MTLHICPHCQKRYGRANMNTDFVHACDSGNATLDQEDVVVIGTWSDYTGSASISTPQAILQGLTNQAYGTDAGIRGAKVYARTVRGARASTHRQRQHLEYIDHAKDS